MKKFWLALVVVVAVCFLCLGDAFAKGGKKKGNFAPTAADTFAQLDKDHDGKVTLDEYKAGKLGTDADAAKKTFESLDTNKDGALSLDEYKAGNPDPVASGKKHKKNR